MTKLKDIDRHQFRKISIQPYLESADERTFSASFSSEAPVQRYYGIEILRHDADGIDLSRVRDGKLPLLAFHDQRQWPIGFIERFSLDDKSRKTRGQIHFADTPRAEEPLSLLKQGVPLDLSIGYDLDMETVLHDVATDTFTFRWTPAEVSILPIGADATIGIGRSQSTTGVKLMTDETKPDVTGTESTAPVVDINIGKMKREHVIAKKAGAAEAIHAERKRIADLHELFDLDLVPRNDFYASLRARAVDEGWPLEGARKILMEVLSGEVEPAVDWGQVTDTASQSVRAATHEGRLPPVVVPAKPGNQARSLGSIQMGEDARDKFITGAEEGVLVRACVMTDKEVTRRAREGGMYGKSLRTLAGEYLQLCGENTSKLSDADVASRAISVRASGQTTSDFTHLLSNVANKSLLMGFEEAPETWQLVTRRGQLPDFKTADRINMSGFTGLSEVAEDGEITYGKFADRKETIKLVQYAKKYRMSRQLIINDDLGGLTQVPRMMGRAANRKIGDVFYAVLNGTGPTLTQDSIALWDTSTHKNYVAAATAPNVTTIGTATAAMAKQTDPNSGAVLNIRPRYLVVPVALESTARVLMASQYDPAGTAGTLTPNPYNGRFEVVTDARLDGQTYGTLAWYLFADPNVFDTFEVAFLNGIAEPYLRENRAWDEQGIEYLVGIDFGVSALDFRAVHKYRGN